jgi:hypothetical protein
MRIIEKIASFFAFLASLVSGVIFPGKAVVTSPPEVKSASIYLSSEITFPTIGGELPIDIKLNAEGLTLSAAAIRVVYKYIGTLALLPQDADSFKDGVQARENGSLLEKGWVFPVNEIILDETSRLIMIDFAAVNLNPEGFTSSEEVTLATLDMQVTSLAPKLTFNFDKTQTKVMSKDGTEVKLQLKPGEFAVR